MLFEKEMEARCAYCAWGRDLTEEQVACLKKGIVSSTGACRKFRYDPLRRVPPKPLPTDFSRWKDEDFVL